MKQLRHHQAGVTIVETLIVLSISAIILAAVVIMVPVLQRNQRNDARKRDISYAHSRLTTLVPQIARSWHITGEVMENMFSDDQSAYYSEYGWSDLANWDAVKARVDGSGGVARYPVHYYHSRGAATTTANQFDLWYNRLKSTHIQKHPGPGSDELPDENHFDIFIGWRCQVPTLTRPNPGTAYYPNDVNGTWSATGQVINQFVHEAGQIQFAIVYKLEGVDVWNCHDDSD